MDGFIWFSRATFMLGLVTVVMILIVPLMTWSLWLVKYRKNYKLHKNVFVTTGIVLVGAVLIFEIDVRMNGWRRLAETSPFYDSWLFPILYIHLLFSINATFLWIVTIIKAVRDFPSPAKPGTHSPNHK